MNEIGASEGMGWCDEQKKNSNVNKCQYKLFICKPDFKGWFIFFLFHLLYNFVGKAIIRIRILFVHFKDNTKIFCHIFWINMTDYPFQITP